MLLAQPFLTGLALLAGTLQMNCGSAASFLVQVYPICRFTPRHCGTLLLWDPGDLSRANFGLGRTLTERWKWTIGERCSCRP